MKRFRLSLELKALLLAFMIGASFQLGWNADVTRAACEKCVPLSGGLCVGCMQDPYGYPSCTPNQDRCSCEVMPGQCG